MRLVKEPWPPSLNTPQTITKLPAGQAPSGSDEAQVFTTFRVFPVSVQPLQELHVPELQVRLRSCSRSQVWEPVCPDGHAAELPIHWKSSLDPEQVGGAQSLYVVNHDP